MTALEEFNAYIERPIRYEATEGEAYMFRLSTAMRDELLSALAERDKEIGRLQRDRDKWHDVAWKLAQLTEYESFRHLGIPATQENIDTEASTLICDYVDSLALEDALFKFLDARDVWDHEHLKARKKNWREHKSWIAEILGVTVLVLASYITYRMGWR